MQSKQFKQYHEASLSSFRRTSAPVTGFKSPNPELGSQAPITKQEGPSLDDLIKSASLRGKSHSANDATEFKQSFESCEDHGEYPLNVKGPNGSIRWYPEGCPHCRHSAVMTGALGDMNIPKRFLNCTFENYRTNPGDQENVLRVAREYAGNFSRYLASGACVIMRGNPGTGKNHLSTAIAKKLHSANRSVVRIKASEYLDEYWAKGFDSRQKWLTSLSRVDLLIIDELGRSSESKASVDAFFRLIDLRYEECKPTMVLTNLGRDDLKRTIGSAAYDRLTQGGGRLLNFDWGSERGGL